MKLEVPPRTTLVAISATSCKTNSVKDLKNYIFKQIEREIKMNNQAKAKLTELKVLMEGVLKVFVRAHCLTYLTNPSNALDSFSGSSCFRAP